VIAFSSTTVTKDFEKKKEGEDDFLGLMMPTSHKHVTRALAEVLS
jgi:hypothetical protein